VNVLWVARVVGRRRMQARLPKDRIPYTK